MTRREWPATMAHPWAYMCQQGCGEVSITHTHTDPADSGEGVTYHHYAAGGAKHTVKRVRRREPAGEGADAQEGEAHGHRDG